MGFQKNTQFLNVYTDNTIIVHFFVEFSNQFFFFLKPILDIIIILHDKLN